MLKSDTCSGLNSHFEYMTLSRPNGISEVSSFCIVTALAGWMQWMNLIQMLRSGLVITNMENRSDSGLNFSLYSIAEETFITSYRKGRCSPRPLHGTRFEMANTRRHFSFHLDFNQTPRSEMSFAGNLANQLVGQPLWTLRSPAQTYRRWVQIPKFVRLKFVENCRKWCTKHLECFHMKE